MRQDMGLVILGGFLGPHIVGFVDGSIDRFFTLKYIVQILLVFGFIYLAVRFKKYRRMKIAEKST